MDALSGGQGMNRQVSVIIPTYNYADYLPKAIDSVLAQSYPHIEVIVVNDGSTDHTAEVIKAYAGKVRYIEQGNQGAAAARNRGLQAAKGDYLCFLDADDAYLPDNVAEKVAFLAANPEFDGCYSNWAWVDKSDKEVMRGDEPKVSLAHLKAQGDVLDLALQGYRLGTNVFMFRKALTDKLQGFDTSLKVLEDYDYFVRAAACGKLGYVNQVLCHIYQHQGSLGTGCDKYTGYRNRWRLNKKLSRMFAERLRRKAVSQAWRKQQADVYRNLADFAQARGHIRRAKVLLGASLAYQTWQFGAWLTRIRLEWMR